MKHTWQARRALVVSGKARRAKTMGSWIVPINGYRVDLERPRDPAGVHLDEAEAVHVHDMFSWYLEEGHSLMGLTKRLERLGVVNPSGKKRWNTATVRGILTNPVYMGKVYAGPQSQLPLPNRPHHK